ncbi:unnamed protein product, partial [Durusdinium trenchii]
YLNIGRLRRETSDHSAGVTRVTTATAAERRAECAFGGKAKVLWEELRSSARVYRAGNA